MESSTTTVHEQLQVLEAAVVTKDGPVLADDSTGSAGAAGAAGADDNARSNEALVEATPIDPDDDEEGGAKQVAIPESLLLEAQQAGGSTGIKQMDKATFIVLAVAAFILVTSVVIGAVCGSGHCGSSKRDDSTITNSTAACSYRAQTIKTSIIQALEDDAYFDIQLGEDEKENTQYLARQKALNWIVYEDPRQLELDVPNSTTTPHNNSTNKNSGSHLLQRFILALFYFQTNQERPWKFCGPPVGKEADYCYYPTDTAGNEFVGMRWLMEVHECQWAGIFCAAGDNKNVTEMSLVQFDLNGPLPSELSKLSQLETLQFMSNNLTSTIPATLANLSNLETLGFSANRLSGTIPPQLFGGSSSGMQISHLIISENYLSGRIPTEAGLFRGTKLGISRNILSGSIPTELFSNTLLSELYLSNNIFSGSIPSHIGQLENLLLLEILDNQLSGVLPTALSLLSNLRYLYLSRNTDLEGTIPEELYQGVISMAHLWLSNCALTGTLSTKFGLWHDLLYFEISNNHLFGTIPETLDTLTNLATFIVSGNDFTGTMPESICNLNFQSQTASTFGFSIKADCKIDAHNNETSSAGTTNVNDSSPAALVCPPGCCTECCNPISGICFAQ